MHSVPRAYLYAGRGAGITLLSLHSEMFSSPLFTSTGDNFIDMFNAKAAAHASSDALADQVRKRKLSPVRARPLSQKALKAVAGTLETIPHRWFGEHEVHYASEGSWEDSSECSSEDSEQDSADSLLGCSSSLGSKLASSDETMPARSFSGDCSAVSLTTDGTAESMAASAPASIGMCLCEAQVLPAEAIVNVAPASPANSQMSAMESTLDAELTLVDIFELPDGTVFHGTRLEFHEKLWGNRAWREECMKEMTPAEYLGMLRKHDPEHYKDTLLILDAIHHAYEY